MCVSSPSIEDYTPGIVGVAVPVFVDGPARLGAFNVAKPSVREVPAHRQRLVSMLRDLAAADGSAAGIRPAP
jgi:DNA-binding IclR family transcriptional regulator